MNLRRAQPRVNETRGRIVAGKAIGRRFSRIVLEIAIVLAAASSTLASQPAPSAYDASSIGATLPIASAIPFIGILLSIALFPLFAPHFWHRHYAKVSLAWALCFGIPFLLVYRGEAVHEILHIYLADYIPFIILLWGLFTVAGGVLVRGAFSGSPAMNTAALLLGTVLASCVGTTGAAMLLIRPVLRANQHRRYRAHVVIFFIFLVANIGGSLTPLGDPPLFLGFLHGVPFFWTLRLLPHTALSVTVLLAVFYLLDRRYHRLEGTWPTTAPTGNREPLRVEGVHNLVLLGGIVGAVALSGVWDAGSVTVLGIELEVQDLVRDAWIFATGLVSLASTPRSLRKANGFTWGPIAEVAFLFAGIFMTIIPALAILRAGDRGQLAFLVESVREPWHYFWAVGGLSSFLDNAPTYLAFLHSQLGRFYAGEPVAVAVPRLVTEHAAYVEAIAAGAVFMGANTYIGNAPNFMVRSIAEEAGVAMPSFFGYMLRWSVPILIPLFMLVGWIFF